MGSCMYGPAFLVPPNKVMVPQVRQVLGATGVLRPHGSRDHILYDSKGSEPRVRSEKALKIRSFQEKHIKALILHPTSRSLRGPFKETPKA